MQRGRRSQGRRGAAGRTSHRGGGVAMYGRYRGLQPQDPLLFAKDPSTSLDSVQITLTPAQFEQLTLRNRGMSRPRNSTSESSSRTVWYHHLEGDVDIPEICLFSISNSCRYNDKGCRRLHAKCPLQWQFEKDDHWYNFREFHSKELEAAFQKPELDCVSLSVIDPEKLDKGFKMLANLLGTHMWVADFDHMTLKDDRESLKIRRVSTHSSAFSGSKMATVYEWYFKDEYNNWIKYGQPNSVNKADCIPNITSDDLELQFSKEKAKTFEFQSDNHCYILDFTKMIQTNKKTQVSRPVRRRTKQRPIKGSHESMKLTKEGNLPSYWAPAKPDLVYEQFTLSRSDPEFSKVEVLIQKTFPNCSINQIKRNQNPYLFNAYQNKLLYIAKKCGISDISEEYLFHGTDPSNVNSICEQNLDWRLHGSNVGQVYGRGSYFANSARFSDMYSRPGADGNKVLLVVKVIVGTTAVGRSDMIRPPLNSATGNLFDTTVDNLAAPKIFVKYDNQEYYPEYVVYYK